MKEFAPKIQMRFDPHKNAQKANDLVESFIKLVNEAYTQPMTLLQGITVEMNLCKLSISALKNGLKPDSAWELTRQLLVWIQENGIQFTDVAPAEDPKGITTNPRIAMIERQLFAWFGTELTWGTDGDTMEIFHEHADAKIDSFPLDTPEDDGEFEISWLERMHKYQEYLRSRQP